MSRAHYPAVQLRYVARTGTGHTPSRSRPDFWVEEERTIPWMTLADVGQLRAGTVDVVTETAELITPAGVANSSAVVHPAGTVLLSRTASVGFSAMMGCPMAVSQDFMTWTPGPLLVGRFLLQVLRGMRPALLGLMHGSTHKTIYMPDLLALRAPLPPVDRQHAIVDFLDHESGRIAAAITGADRLVASALPPALEVAKAEFDQQPLGRIGYRFSVQLGKKLYEDRVAHDTAVPYLRNANVQWDQLKLDDLKVMNFDAREREMYSLRRGDLLVCEGGEPGRSAVWDGELNECFFQMALNRVRPYADDSTRYLMWALRVLSGRDAFAVDGPGRYTHLTAEMLRAVRVPMPASAVQYERVAEIDASASRGRQLAEVANRIRARLTEYREALITEAVTGQLDVTAVSDAQMDERAHAAGEGAAPANQTPARVG